MKILLTTNINNTFDYPLASDQDIATSPFKTDTNTNYYNRFLDTEQLDYMRSAKNRDGKIVLMSPNEYFEACANDVFVGESTADDLKHQREYSKFENGKSFVDSYKDAMLQWDKFPLPFINFADPTQEGLHRMYSAGEAFGWDTPLPVLIITAYDQTVEDKWNFQQEIQDFERDKLKYYCQSALDELSDWYSPVPDQFPQLLRNLVLQQASNNGYDIDVDVEIKEIDDRGNTLHQVLVYLTEYMGHEITDLSEPYVDWLENLFDVNGDRQKPYKSSSVSDDNDNLYNLLFK